jgi:hypothetical protein
VIKKTWDAVNQSLAQMIAISSFRDLVLMTYVEKDTHRNRVLIVDVNPYTQEQTEGIWAFGVFDGLTDAGITMFAEAEDRFFFGKHGDSNLYEFMSTADGEGQGGLVHGEFLTRLYNGAQTIDYKAIRCRARGYGTVWITPIVDGVEYPDGRLTFQFNDDTNTEEQYAPRQGKHNWFKYRGKNIQLKVEAEAANGRLIIYPPTIGFLTRGVRVGGQRMV